MHDPNEMLRNIRDLVTDIEDACKSDRNRHIEPSNDLLMAEQLAEAVAGLDEMLSARDNLPREWR